MLSDPIVKDIIAAWRAVWDCYDLDPQHIGWDGMAAKLAFWGKALGKAGMTDADALALNSLFLLEWSGTGAPKLGHLLGWLRNRPAASHHAPDPKTHPLLNPKTNKHAGKAIARMLARLQKET